MSSEMWTEATLATRFFGEGFLGFLTGLFTSLRLIRTCKNSSVSSTGLMRRCLFSRLAKSLMSGVTATVYTLSARFTQAYSLGDFDLDAFSTFLGLRGDEAMAPLRESPQAGCIVVDSILWWTLSLAHEVAADIENVLSIHFIAAMGGIILGTVRGCSIMV
jgi:hypothetical protein